MKKLNFTKIFTIAFYLLFFLLLLKNSLGYLDPDLGWHLKAGEEVVKTGQINRINHYNYVLEENNTWVNHEWLSDSIIFLIYNNYNYFTLNIVFALLMCLILGIAHNFIVKNFTFDRKSKAVLLPFFALGIIACQPSLGVRIQELTILFLLLELIIIYKFENESLKNNKYFWKKLLILPIIIGLWANMHGGFLLGIFIMYFYLGIKTTELIIFYLKDKISFINKLSSFLNFNKKLNKKDLKIFLFFSIISSLSTLINPYGLKLFDFLFSYKNNAYLKIIGEWLPQYQEPFLYWQILYIGITIAAYLVSFLMYKNKKEINSLWHLVLILFFIVLAIKSRRHFPLLFISSLPFLSSFIYDEIKETIKNIKLGKTIIDIFIKAYLSFVFLFVFLLLATSIKVIKNPFAYYCQKYPCQALEFIKNDPKISSARIFNSYGWGGYLIHQWPEKKIFIDGRLPQIKIKNHSYLEEYLLFFKDEQNIKQKIEEYQIELFLLEKRKTKKTKWLDQKLTGSKETKDKNNQLINYLEANFNKIYEDDIALIYFKRNGL